MKTFQKIIVSIFIMIFFIFVVLFALGYRLVVDQSARPDWECISAIGTWCIPIAVIFIEISFQKKQKAIENSNEKVIQELTDFKNKFGQDIENWSKINRGEESLDGGIF